MVKFIKTYIYFQKICHLLKHNFFVVCIVKWDCLEKAAFVLVLRQKARRGRSLEDLDALCSSCGLGYQHERLNEKGEKIRAYNSFFARGRRGVKCLRICWG